MLELRQKRKLQVIKNEDNYYIDIYAARELDIRALNTTTIKGRRFIEIDENRYRELARKEDIQIDLINYMGEIGNDNDSKSIEEGRLAASLKELLLSGKTYGIALHGIHSGTDIEKTSSAIQIMQDGLNMPNMSQSILSSSISLGELDNVKEAVLDIENYKYGQGTTTNVVLAIPETIKNSKDETIFLGFPERNLRTAAQQYDPHCILDRICSAMRKVPSEFILGYYIESGFIDNDRHISHMSEEQIDELFSNLTKNMNEITMDLNDSIVKGDLPRMQNTFETCKNRGISTKLIENMIKLTEKYSYKENNPDRKRLSNITNKRKIMLNNDKDR